MIRKLAFGVVLVTLASPAQALSCLRPDVARTYSQAAEAEERYVVVHGKLRFDEQQLPQPAGNDSPPSTKIPARLTGSALSKGRFDHPFDRAIVLDILCFGPWCGGARSDLSYLGFLEATEGRYTLTIDPCGGQAFTEPTSEMLRRVKQCNTGAPCKARTE